MLDALDKHLEHRTYLLRIAPSDRLVESLKEFKRLLAKRSPEEQQMAVDLVNDLVTISHRVRVDQDRGGFGAWAEPSTEMLQMIAAMQREEKRESENAAQ